MSLEAATDLLELEAMSLGVGGKRRLWLALEKSGVSAGLDLPRMIARAQSQRDRLNTARTSSATLTSSRI